VQAAGGGRLRIIEKLAAAEKINPIGFAISNALAHAAQRLAPPAGERILDLATAAGWSARNIAWTGRT
jgi:hypothetical protein